MKLLNEHSLALTLNNLFHSRLFSIAISSQEQEEIAQWMVQRVGLRGSYFGLVAPTDQDFQEDVYLFTGEKLSSRASKAHILGEDALSFLHSLKLRDSSMNSVIEYVREMWQKKIMEDEKVQGSPMGFFCCGKCTNAYWRGLLAGTLEKREERLEKGMEILRSLRDGKGRWRRFPFYNTLWVLESMPGPLAKEELEYARSGLERIARRIIKEGLSKEGLFEKRRRAIIEIVLGHK